MLDRHKLSIVGRYPTQGSCHPFVRVSFRNNCKWTPPLCLFGNYPQNFIPEVHLGEDPSLKERETVRESWKAWVKGEKSVRDRAWSCCCVDFITKELTICIILCTCYNSWLADPSTWWNSLQVYETPIDQIMFAVSGELHMVLSKILELIATNSVTFSLIMGFLAALPIHVWFVCSSLTQNFYHPLTLLCQWHCSYR